MNIEHSKTDSYFTTTLFNHDHTHEPILIVSVIYVSAWCIDLQCGPILIHPSIGYWARGGNRPGQAASYSDLYFIFLIKTRSSLRKTQYIWHDRYLIHLCVFKWHQESNSPTSSEAFMEERRTNQQSKDCGGCNCNSLTRLYFFHCGFQFAVAVFSSLSHVFQCILRDFQHENIFR